jgi:hypothetical protein
MIDKQPIGIVEPVTLTQGMESVFNRYGAEDDPKTWDYCWETTTLAAVTEKQFLVLKEYESKVAVEEI